MSAAIKTDGTLWAWGNNTFGQLGLSDITDRYSPVQVGGLTAWSQVSGGYRHTVAIKTDGNLYAWGGNQQGQLGQNNIFNLSIPTKVGGTLYNDWTEVVCGDVHTIGLRNNGTVWAWGANSYSGLATQALQPTQIGTLSNIGLLPDNIYRSSFAINSSGKLYAWGDPTNGALGRLDAVYAPVQIPADYTANKTWSKI